MNPEKPEKGQRWQYKSYCVIEIEKNDRGKELWGYLIQELDHEWCQFRTHGHNVYWCFDIQKDAGWVYLEGQDAP